MSVAFCISVFHSLLDASDFCFQQASDTAKLLEALKPGSRDQFQYPLGIVAMPWDKVYLKLKKHCIAFLWAK